MGPAGVTRTRITDPTYLQSREPQATLPLGAVPVRGTPDRQVTQLSQTKTLALKPGHPAMLWYWPVRATAQEQSWPSTAN